MSSIQLTRSEKKISGNVHLGGSKSISNRLLIMQSLSKSGFELSNLSQADDTALLSYNLNEINFCRTRSIPMIIDAGNAGTTMRFLAAFLAITKGRWLLTGSARMKERPIGDLVSALNELGAAIKYTSKSGFPPLKIDGKKLHGNEIKINSAVSSQFISALMLIAPYLSGGLKISLEGQPVSVPYIEMTSRLMRQAGAEVEMDDNTIVIKSGNYSGEKFEIEPDWSSAAFWYEIVALSDNAEILLCGLKANSLQGDRVTAEVFENLGVKTEFTRNGAKLVKSALINKKFSYDFSGCPDLVPAVMVTCAALHIEAIFKGVAHLKFKESDRMECLKTELAKMGAALIYQDTFYRLIPRKKKCNNIVFNTYNDHRLAMSFAPLVQVCGAITIHDPHVVSKSYPGFWKDIQKLNVCKIQIN